MKLLLACSLACLLGACSGYDTTVGAQYTMPDGTSIGGTVKLQHSPK